MYCKAAADGIVCHYRHKRESCNNTTEETIKCRNPIKERTIDEKKGGGKKDF